MWRAKPARSAPAPRSSCSSERLGTAHAVLAAESALRAGRRRRRRRLRRHAARRGGDLRQAAGAARRRVRPSPCSGSRRAIRPATAASSWRATGSSPSARSGTPPTRSAASRLCNAGLMALSRRDRASSALRRIGNDNAKGEYYLTDAVATVIAMGGKARRRHGAPRTRCRASTTARSSPRPSASSRSGCGARPWRPAPP